MLVLIGSPYFKIVTVSNTLTSERLDVCLRENFENLNGYTVLTKTQYDVYYACYMHGIRIGLSQEQISECFWQWLDAVENSGVSVENDSAFKSMFTDSLNDFERFGS